MIKNSSIMRILVIILALVCFVMVLPAGAIEEEHNEGEDIIEEFDNVGTGYIILTPPYWVCSSTFGLFSGTITVYSLDPSVPSFADNIYESHSGTFTTSGYNQVRFTGWVRAYYTQYDALYRTDNYYEYYVDFLSTF